MKPKLLIKKQSNPETRLKKLKQSKPELVFKRKIKLVKPKLEIN